MEDKLDAGDKDEKNEDWKAKMFFSGGGSEK